MALILTIENEQSLPNGAPVSVRLTDRRGIDIGRSANIDWSLPDPTRFISGRHCEVRYRDGDYWLNDLSTNGTFLNDSARRIQAPHKLRHGDRLAIGSYIIAVAIEADNAPEYGSAGAAPQAGSVVAVAPIGYRDAATLDAEIAQAIAIETAPPSQSPPEPAPDSSGRINGAEGSDVLEVAARSRENAAARPFTMVRARGFFVPPEPAGEAETPAKPSDVPPLAGLDEEKRETSPPLSSTSANAADAEAQNLDPHDLEALAWSAPERNTRSPASPPAKIFESPQNPPDSDNRPPDAPTPAPKAASSGAPGPDEFLRSFAKGAGIPDHIFARQDGLKVAEELGALMRMAVEDLTQLLSARFKAKRFARTSSQTMIQALDNNPLKFAPTADDALKIMFGPRTSGYLDARRAFEGAFTDLKTHQITTFAAMQQAVRMLVEDLDPKAIEAAAGEDKGLAALFGAHKARLWDLFLARWQAKTLRHEDGLVDAFMLYFAQCYDQSKDVK